MLRHVMEAIQDQGHKTITLGIEPNMVRSAFTANMDSSLWMVNETGERVNEYM